MAKHIVSTLLPLTAVLLLLILPSISAAKKPNDVPSFLTANSKKFSRLVGYLKKAELIPALSGKTRATVFAPSNSAFTSTIRKYLDKLSKADLANVLKYHVVPDLYDYPDFRTGTLLRTLNFDQRFVRSTFYDRRGVLFSDATANSKAKIIRGKFSAGKILKSSKVGSFAFVHEIDSVLLSQLAVNATYETLEQALKGENLTQYEKALRTYDAGSDLLDIKNLLDDSYFFSGTIFAISDAAFEKWVEKEECTDGFSLWADFLAYSFTFEPLPLPSLVDQQLIGSVNFYDEDLGIGPAQPLLVRYVRGKPQIRAQPWRQATDPFWNANILKTVYIRSDGSLVLHIIDTVLYPLNGADETC